MLQGATAAPQATQTLAAAAAPKPPPKKATSPIAGAGAAPAKEEAAPAGRGGSKKAPPYVEPRQSFPDEDEFGTSEQETAPSQMEILFGGGQSRGPLAGSDQEGETRAVLDRIGRVKELRSRYTPYATPEDQPYVMDARKPRRQGPYGGVESPAGFPVPSESELASPVAFRDAGVGYTAAYKAAQNATVGALKSQDELVKKYMGGRTMNPADPDYDAREIAAARQMADRRQALETAQRGRELQAAKNTLRQYGYTDDDIDKL